MLVYACSQQEEEQALTPKIEKSHFQDFLQEHTQRIAAQDLGEGRYRVEGEQGTIIDIENGLVNSAGERVRGNIEIELIEIYNVKDMILARKQTLADYDGAKKVLESGGEVFVQPYQNGEALKADGQGNISIMLPTENTGGPRDNMELYYGEEIGEQVIWKPTGEKVPVISNHLRSELSYYIVTLQNALGWINVDIIYEGDGEAIECIQLEVECRELCDINTSYAAIYVNSLNSAFELTQISPTSFELCDEMGSGISLGGVNVTFIVMIECRDGSIQVAFVNATLTPGMHLQSISCDQLRFMDRPSYESELSNLMR